MNNVIFISNELLNSELQKSMKLPLQFICFAIIDGKMYRHYGNHNIFTLPLDNNKKWGNSKVYGALFLCSDVHFYIDIIDSYHVCSMSKLMRNHKFDLHHRHRVMATPIFFNSLDDLSRLKYREGEAVEVTTYVGNINHNKIKQRLSTTKTYRVYDGVYKEGFIKLYKEVANVKQ